VIGPTQRPLSDNTQHSQTQRALGLVAFKIHVTLGKNQILDS